MPICPQRNAETWKSFIRVRVDVHAVIEPIEISKKEALKTVPRPNADGSDPAPLDYNGGRIYVSGAKQAYRTIRTRGNYYSEKAFSWKRLSAPTRKLWKSALDAIDAQRASE